MQNQPEDLRNLGPFNHSPFSEGTIYEHLTVWSVRHMQSPPLENFELERLSSEDTFKVRPTKGRAGEIHGVQVSEIRDEVDASPL